MEPHGAGAATTTSIWNSSGQWLLGWATATLAVYWQQAPEICRMMFQWLLPLLLLECATAAWMQRLARTRRAAPAADDPDVLIYENDDWLRAFRRLGLLVVFLCLAALADKIAGFPHYSVTIVVTVGAVGHTRATLRHCSVISAYHHFDWPEWMDGLLGHPPRPLGWTKAA